MIESVSDDTSVLHHVTINQTKIVFPIRIIAPFGIESRRFLRNCNKTCPDTNLTNSHAQFSFTRYKPSTINPRSTVSLDESIVRSSNYLGMHRRTLGRRCVKTAMAVARNSDTRFQLVHRICTIRGRLKREKKEAEREKKEKKKTERTTIMKFRDALGHSRNDWHASVAGLA